MWLPSFIGIVIVGLIVMAGVIALGIVLGNRQREKAQAEHDAWVKEQRERMEERRITRTRLDKFAIEGKHKPVAIPHQPAPIPYTPDPLLDPSNPLSPLSPLWIGHSAPEPHCPDTNMDSSSVDSSACDSGSSDTGSSGSSGDW